jgi:glycosyltransferase involved in cell wall biosynthesis
MLISIITINYNDAVGLKKTMASVLEQTYEDIEYIVIDGGSADGSKAYIELYQKDLAYWVSEPDQGIYHAMNKGIDKATGDYLLFMNSGDWLVDDYVIERFVGFHPIEDIVYGDHRVSVGNKFQRKFMPKEMSIGIALTNTINHQSIFYSKEIFKNNRYDLEYKILADWVLTNNSIVFDQCSTRYINLVICHYDLNGISSSFSSRHGERNRYLKENFDPLFLRLLKDYKSLHSKHAVITSSSLVKMSLLVLQKRRQLFQYFKR